MNPTEPTADTINRDIAEWRGWKFIPSHDIQFGHVFKAISEFWLSPTGESAQDIPAYTNSHDACAEALGKMTHGQLHRYIHKLGQEFVGGSLEIFRATPAQKALAIWRVVKGN